MNRKADTHAKKAMREVETTPIELEECYSFLPKSVLEKDSICEARTHSFAFRKLERLLFEAKLRDKSSSLKS